MSFVLFLDPSFVRIKDLDTLTTSTPSIKTCWLAKDKDIVHPHAHRSITHEPQSTTRVWCTWIGKGSLLCMHVCMYACGRVMNGVTYVCSMDTKRGYRGEKTRKTPTTDRRWSLLLDLTYKKDTTFFFSFSLLLFFLYSSAHTHHSHETAAAAATTTSTSTAASISICIGATVYGYGQFGPEWN